MPASIEESLATRLLTDTAVTAVLGQRVYPDDLPAQLPAGPRAEIDLTDEQDSETLDGSGGGTFAAVVTVYARLKGTANRAARLVRDSLDGYRGGELARVWWDGTAAVEVEAGCAYQVSFAGRYRDLAGELARTRTADARTATADTTAITADRG